MKETKPDPNPFPKRVGRGFREGGKATPPSQPVSAYLSPSQIETAVQIPFRRRHLPFPPLRGT